MLLRLTLPFLLIAGQAMARLDPGVMGGIIAGSVLHLQGGNAGPVWQDQITLRSGKVDMSVLDRMQEKLRTRLSDAHLDSRCYERRSFGQLVYRYCFEFSLARSTWDTTVTMPWPWGDEVLELKPQLAVLRYGFAARTGDNMGADSYNLAVFLNSAYHQELFPGYAKADSNFLPPLRKSQWGLWSRGAVSMGWGAQYTAEGNPLATGGAVSLAKWLLYGMDAIFYIAMAVAAAEGREADAMLLYALQAKALHTGISFAVFTPLMSMELSEILRIRDSGYRLPVGMLFRW